MAEPISINLRTRLISSGDERRIDCYTDYVCAGRHWRLAVPAIEDEELSGQMKVIRIRPAGTDSLIARNPNGSAIAELRLPRIRAA